jgi:hypothetical protein
MSAHGFLLTAILLGFFVLWAGAYGVCYCLARLKADRSVLLAARVCYALLCATALALVFSTTLALQWKVLLVASAAAYLRIPPLTWNYLVRLHENGGHP